MFKFLVTTLALTAALVGFVLISRPHISGGHAEEADASRSSRRSPVLVELFTSEGCSSCPPADELLTRLDQDQSVAGAEVIALSEHVDYWNRLGWADPYSSPEFSARQNDYGSVFSSDEVYTPQMVVDGRIQFVGSNESKARDAITQAGRDPKAEITITQTRTQAGSSGEIAFDVSIGSLPSGATGNVVDVMLAITESGLRSTVSRGENAGRRLTHTAVVRKLSNLGVVGAASGSFSGKAGAKVEREWDRNNLKAVVFAQERASHRVLGAASVSLATTE